MSIKTLVRSLNLIVVLAGMAILACPAAMGSDYISLVRSAIDRAAAGQTRESFALAAQAADLDPDDPLTKTLLGYLQAMGGSADTAKAYYTAALKKDPECAYAAYGLALLALNSGKPETALESLTTAQSLGPLLNMRGTLEYAKYLSTNSAKELDHSNDGLIDVVQAYYYERQGKNEAAINLLEQCLQGTGKFTYKEYPGLSASFNPAKPVSASAWPLRKTDVLVSFKTRKIQPVSGVLTLKADLRRANTVKMVSFLIDGRLACITNQSPFSFEWNTKNVSDGLHNVVIQGSNDVGTTITSKTARVFVKNDATGTAAQKDPINYRKAWSELWEAMRLKPSVCAINYGIAVCAMNSGKLDRAQAALENVLAINPGFRDAKARLIKLRGGGRNDVKVYSSRKAINRIALTFDDGPTPAVAGALDILRQKGVKATFFVVGKQVETFPELLKSIHRDGNEIQNHTFNHLALSYIDSELIQREYFSTSCAVRNVIGIGTSYIRPPGGRSSSELYTVLKQYGVLSILWSVNCVSREGTNKNKLASYVLNSVRPGSIVLMHYGDMVAQQALPAIIDGLKARRYSFVTVSELLSE